MVKQAENMYRQATVQLREKKEPQNWRALKEQLFSKFLLRLVSCVQLASKLSFHYKVSYWGPPVHLLAETSSSTEDCEKPPKLGVTTPVETPGCNYAS